MHYTVSWSLGVNLLIFRLADEQIRDLLTDGALKIDLAQYIEEADQMLVEACKRYSEQLMKFLRHLRMNFRTTNSTLSQDD